MSSSVPSTLPVNHLSRSAARLSLGSAVLFLVLLGALHVLRPDLDPSWRFISEYELGDYGGMMRLAFFALSLSCASFCVAVFPHVRTIPGYLGVFLVTVSAAGMALAGVFAPDKVNKLHEVGAMLDHVPFGALFINWSLFRNPEWRSSRKLLAATAPLPLIGLIAFMGSLAVMLPANGGQPGPTVLAGWPNRFFILMHCAWLMPIAWRTLTMVSPAVQVPGNRD